MRTVFLAALLFSFLRLSAQEKTLISGQVRDMTTNDGLASVHVVNLQDTLATITDLQGVFRIPAKIGDTILFSSIGFTDRLLAVNDSVIKRSPLYVGLAPKVYEIGEVTVNPLGSKAQFRKEFMNLELADDHLEIPGVPRKEVRDYPVWEDAEEIKKAKYVLNPVSYLYYNFNRHAKARQQYRKLTELDHKLDEAKKKVDTLNIAKYTGLKGDSLNIFIKSCGFTDSYLLRATEYDVMLLVQRKFEEFSTTAIKEKE